MHPPMEPPADPAPTCLVTGAAGLIGSHVVERRLAAGDRVVGVDDFNGYYDPRQKRDNVAGFLGHPRFTLAEFDLRGRRRRRRPLRPSTGPPASPTWRRWPTSATRSAGRRCTRR